MTATVESLFPGTGFLRAWRARPAVAPVQRPLRAAPVHELARNAIVALPAARGELVECLEGCLWITFDYDSRDVVVQAGQSFVVDRDGAGTVQALEAARIRVTTPAAVATSVR